MPSREALVLWVRRPVVLAVLSAVALSGLLAGSLVVARAVEGTPTATSSASPAGGTGGNGDDSVAIAQNGTDGRTVYAIRLKIVQTTADTVDAGNAAVAVASCTDCTTVAISFEGVVVVGSPTDFEPTNLAIAYNESCSGCTTFAAAYQKVVQQSYRVRITAEGRRRVAEIRRDLETLRTSDLSLDEIVARVKADEAAFAEVLENECVPVGRVTSPPPSDAPEATAAPSSPAAASEPATSSPATASTPADSPSPDESSTGSASASPTPSSSG